MSVDLLGFPTPHDRELRKRPTTEQALEWRAWVAAMNADRDPCPGFRNGEWKRVRAAILETLDCYGDELVFEEASFGSVLTASPFTC